MDGFQEVTNVCTEGELQELARQSMRDLWFARSRKPELQPALTSSGGSKGQSGNRGRKAKAAKHLESRLPNHEVHAVALQTESPAESRRRLGPERNSAAERIEQKIRARSVLGFDGPAVHYPLISREELLTAQAIDSLQSALPYHTHNVEEGRRGGLRTSFVDGFTRCPTRHPKCGLLLRIEAAAASVARGRFDDPPVLRVVGERGVSSAMDLGRRGEDGGDGSGARAGESGRPAFRSVSRLSRSADIKRDVAREAASGAGEWRATPDLYPTELTTPQLRYSFRHSYSESEKAAGAGNMSGVHRGLGVGPGVGDFWLPPSPSRCRVCRVSG